MLTGVRERCEQRQAVSMSEKDSKNFDNPSLKEAICEVRYSSPVSQAPDWGQRMPTNLVAELGHTYPLFDVIDESPFKFVLGNNLVTEVQHKFRFSSKDHNYTLTVKKDAFALILKVDDKSKYSWAEYHKKLNEEWGKLTKILGVEIVNRVGIRFINSLEVDGSLKLGKLLSEKSQYIPSILLGDVPRFTNKTDLSLDEVNKLIVTLVYQKVGDKDKKELFFDIDRIRENVDMPIGCLEKVSEELHTDVETAFFNSITDEYRAIMRPLGKGK